MNPSQREKLESQIERDHAGVLVDLQGNLANVRFRDLVRLLLALGYELRRIHGDHHLFKHPGIEEKLNLQPDRRGDAKSYQVRQVADAIRKYDLKLED